MDDAKQATALALEARWALAVRLQTLSGAKKSGDLAQLANRFVAGFARLPPYCGYHYLPPAVRQLHQQVRQQLGPAATNDFLYICLLRAMLSSLASEAFARLPARVQQHQRGQYRRILNQRNAVTAHCTLEHDLFHKELGLALLRLYAAGAQLVDCHAGIGRSMLLKNGWADLPRRLAIFAHVGGFKPFFEIHTHPAYLDEFHEDGWNECYHCCASLYAQHPQALGMYGGSWFYDPALHDISPRLRYLRQTPQQGGAYLLFDSITDQATKDALATSSTRSQRHFEGTYQPKNFALIWPRAAQLRWSEAQQSIAYAA